MPDEIVRFHPVYLNPPHEVKDAISALVDACEAWQPIAASPTAPPRPDAIEHYVCQVAANPDPLLGMLPMAVAVAVVTAIAVSLAYWAGVHRIPLVIGRMVQRAWRRPGASAHG